jgi:hypothetical protein
MLQGGEQVSRFAARKHEANTQGDMLPQVWGYGGKSFPNIEKK